MLYSTILVLFKDTKKPRIYEASSVKGFIALHDDLLGLFSASRVDGGG